MRVWPWSTGFALEHGEKSKDEKDPKKIKMGFAVAETSKPVGAIVATRRRQRRRGGEKKGGE